MTRGFAERTLATVFAPQAPPEGYLDHLDLEPRAPAPEPPRERPPTRRPEGRAAADGAGLPAPAMPIEIVHGDADRTVGLDIHSAELARQVPQARLTRLPGIGHMLHQVATAQVVERIDAAASRQTR